MNIRALIADRLGRRAARLAAVAAVGAAVLGATAGAAQASTTTVSWNGTPYLITASYDWQNVAVANGSTSVGGPVIQWPADGGAEQEWRFGTVYYSTGAYAGTLIENVNSGLCLTTDGNAGDQVFQAGCDSTNLDQLFNLNGGLNAYDSIYNYGTGLYLDVSGYSWNEGADIDLWYGNDQPNQTFYVLAW